MPVTTSSSVRIRMRGGIILAVLLTAMAFPAFLNAQDTGAHPRIGLVLSGGGARGAAHVGVLKVLEEMNIPIYCIVGTSMGSIVGGLYSSGLTIPELEQIAVKTDWDGLFSDKIPRRDVNFRDKTDWPNYITSVSLHPTKIIDIPQGLVRGKRLDLMLRSLTLNAPIDFNDFPIPFRAIASDIETGNAVVLSKGDLAKSLRASMAIPGAFAPVEIDGHLLVDGGVANNLAIDVARQMGADVVIAVNIGTPLSTRKDLDSFLGVIDQITNILTNRNVEAQLKILGPKDTLLTPELGTITTGSFNRMSEAIEIGDKTARNSQAVLAGYAVSPDEYQAIRSQQLKKVKPLGKIEFVKMDQQSVPGSGFLLDMVTKGADNVLSKNVMSYNIFELYKRGDFEDIDFTLVEEDGKQGLLIKTKQREKTRNVVDLGIELMGTAQRDNSFRIVTRFTAENLNRLGAEWKNELWLGQNSRFFTEFYQPLNPSVWHFFIAPSLDFQNYPVELYEHYTDSNAIAKYRVRDNNAGIDLGLQMGEYGEWRFGYLCGKTKDTLETGLAELPDQELRNGAFKLALKFDQLDSPFFPTQGTGLSAKYIYGRESLGGDENYESVDATLTKPVSYDRHTLIFRGRVATNFDSTDTLARGFFLGGLFNLSGLNTYQVYGNNLALGEVVYIARIKRLSPLIGGNLYAGGSFEAGNAWRTRSEVNTNDLIYAGSLFIGIESNIGPIYIGFGHAEGNQNAIYFSLGAKQY
jgi:NTE family protein